MSSAPMAQQRTGFRSLPQAAAPARPAPAEPAFAETEQRLDLTRIVAAMRAGEAGEAVAPSKPACSCPCGNRCQRSREKQGASVRSKLLYRLGPVSMLLFVFDGAGAELPEHVAHGQATLHLLDGALTVSTADREFALAANGVAALAPCVRHVVRAEEPSALLVTLHERLA